MVEELAGVPVRVEGFVEPGAEVENRHLPAQQAGIAHGGQQQKQRREGLVVAKVSPRAQHRQQQRHPGQQSGQADAREKKHGQRTGDHRHLQRALEGDAREVLQKRHEGQERSLQVLHMPGEQQRKRQQSAQQDEPRLKVGPLQAEGTG